ncbi:MAG TPA: sugar transferase [Terriglobales bacterium]|nr:sugar transferase [Terriglobales bacterium]
MIKVLNQYFPGRLFVLLVTENVLILLAIWATVTFQMGSSAIVAHPALFLKALVVTVICQLCFYYADIYDLRTVGSKLEVFFRLMQALGAAAILIAGLFIVFPDMRMGERVVEISILATVFTILLWRFLVEWLNRAYGGGERILLVGSAAAVEDLAREIKLRPDLPIELLGNVSENEEVHTSVEGLNDLGSLSHLESIISETAPDRVIIALKERRQQLPINMLLKKRMQGLLIEEASTLYQKITGKIPVESIHPSSLIFSEGFLQSPFRRAYARIFGMLGGAGALILCGPLMLLVAIAIKLDSKGPVLYRQMRVGKNGKPFEILKFRSMRIDAETLSGPVWAAEEDPRITRVGRLIRKVRLDELPQFLNVLYGQMGFVGPRPERPHFVEQLAQQIPFYDLRHSVRPGITGWAQVSLHYGATVEDSKEKLEYDLFYIKNLSPSLDFMILFQTIKIVLFGKGAR